MRALSQGRLYSAASILALLLVGCGSGKGGDSDSNGGSPSSTAGTTSESGTTHGGGGSGAAGGAASGQTFDCTASAEASELVTVAAGDFVMGCNEAVDDACDDNEKPMHTVSLSAFDIDKTEVTQAQYTACVTDGACEPPSCAWDCEQADHAAGCISWSQAVAYCEYVGKRLPSEAEWEKAARGSEGGKFPWGDAPPDCSLANLAECGEEAMPVGSLPAGASPYGALDMAGNMVELVADFYDDTYYAESPASDPAGPDSGNRYGGRGGGYKSDAAWLRTSKRDWYDPEDSAASLGFRCAQ